MRKSKDTFHLMLQFSIPISSRVSYSGKDKRGLSKGRRSVEKRKGTWIRPVINFPPHGLSVNRIPKASEEFVSWQGQFITLSPSLLIILSSASLSLPNFPFKSPFCCGKLIYIDKLLGGPVENPQLFQNYSNESNRGRNQYLSLNFPFELLCKSIC